MFNLKAKYRDPPQLQLFNRCVNERGVDGLPSNTAAKGYTPPQISTSSSKVSTN